MDNITNLVDEIIDDIKSKIIREEAIDVLGLMKAVGTEPADMNRVRDLLVKHKQITKGDWDKLLAQARRSSRYGRTPRDAQDFVALWAEHNKVEARFNKTLTVNRPVVIGGDAIPPEGHEDASIDAYARIMANGDIAIDSMVRQLRLENESMGFGCSNTSIQDAALEWFEESSRKRRWMVFKEVSGAHEIASRHTEDWKRFARAFDHKEHNAEFVIAVFQKFMWQVKRKMLGLPISDHLMPVVLGPQGTGKSTFIRERLLTPVAELTFDTNFAQVTDTKIIDMWEFNVLFLDEMGQASKADVDEVKNVVTAAYVPRRPMGFNTIKQQPQRAVFIGCSNKELDQLIRDETGVRRFVGVRFSHTPNRDEINAIDYAGLWRSVNERGEDPMLPFKAELTALQAASKATTPVEEWYTQYAPFPETWGKDVASSLLFSEFASWCTGKYDKHVDLGGFTREFNRVIKSDPASRWSNKRKKTGNAFVFN